MGSVPTKGGPPRASVRGRGGKQPAVRRQEGPPQPRKRPAPGSRPPSLQSCGASLRPQDDRDTGALPLTPKPPPDTSLASQCHKAEQRRMQFPETLISRSTLWAGSESQESRTEQTGGGLAGWETAVRAPKPCPLPPPSGAWAPGEDRDLADPASGGAANFVVAAEDKSQLQPEREAQTAPCPAHLAGPPGTCPGLVPTLTPTPGHWGDRPCPPLAVLPSSLRHAAPQGRPGTPGSGLPACHICKGGGGSCRKSHREPR